ncbi:MAG: hypothetical protein GY811_05450 [Myxococcales bacterium]|nr:hypothetical protein [Myxococcales bacterium]
MRNTTVKIASTLVLSLPLLASSILTGSCQQGEGEFCQVTVDCEDGLECNAATQRCQKPGTANTTPDAAPVVIPDAATVVDAGVDASAPDATAFDASQPDGAPTS